MTIGGMQDRRSSGKAAGKTQSSAAELRWHFFADARSITCVPKADPLGPLTTEAV